MRTPRTLERGIADLLTLLGMLVARGPDELVSVADGELRRRAEHDLEVAVEAVRRLAQRLDVDGAPVPAGRPRPESLTTRERLMADMLCAGKSYKDIANTLNLSVLSVQSRVKQIYMKLAVHSKAELRSILIRSEAPEPFAVASPTTTPSPVMMAEDNP